MILSRRAGAAIRTLALTCFALVAGASPAGAATRSEDIARILFASPLPWTLPQGAIQGWVGGSISQHTPQPFEESGSPRPERTLLTLPLGAAGALAPHVEASLRFGAAWSGGPDGSGGVVPGDVDIRLGYSFEAGPAWMDALAAWLTAKAPTGTDRGGVSTDEADLGLGASAGWRHGRLWLFGHAGLELLGNPLRNGSQDDVAAYGAGAIWRLGEAWHVSGEVEGRAFSRFGNSASRLSAGGAWGGAPRGRSRLAAGGKLWHGLDGDAATWGIHLFVSATRF